MIALAFWGLTRSTDYTAESIERYVYDCLPQRYVFVHTYTSTEPYMNDHANEKANGIVASYERLKPYKVEVDDLDEVKRKIPFERYRTHRDPWNSNYQTMDHFILAMYSKERVTEMVEKSGLPFKTVIFLRPDVRYRSPIALLLRMASTDNWVIPRFHLYNGFNDRFCIASAKNYVLYGRVFYLLLSYSRRKPLHSETFYGDLAKTARVRVTYAPPAFVFERVRMNGSTDSNDLLLYKAVGHIPGHASDTQNVELHNRVFRYLPVRKAFTSFLGDGVGLVRKPTRIVRLDV